MALEQQTAKVTEDIIQEFCGDASDFWADAMMKPETVIYRCEGLPMQLTLTHPNGRRKTWCRFTTFQGNQCQIEVRQLSTTGPAGHGLSDHPMAGRPQLTVTHDYYSAFHPNDPRFAEVIQHRADEEDMDVEDRTPNDDKFWFGQQHTRVYTDKKVVFEDFPEFTGRPGEEADMTKYDYRASLKRAFQQLSHKHAKCVIPGCNRFAPNDCGGYCTACIKQVNAKPCPCCGHVFGFMDPTTQCHTLCAHLHPEKRVMNYRD